MALFASVTVPAIIAASAAGVSAPVGPLVESTVMATLCVSRASTSVKVRLPLGSGVVASVSASSPIVCGAGAELVIATASLVPVSVIAMSWNTVSPLLSRIWTRKVSTRVSPAARNWIRLLSTE